VDLSRSKTPGQESGAEVPFTPTLREAGEWRMLGAQPGAVRFVVFRVKSGTHGRLRLYFHGLRERAEVKCANRRWDESATFDLAKLLKIKLNSVHWWDKSVPRKTAAFFHQSGRRVCLRCACSSYLTMACGGSGGAGKRLGIVGNLLWRQWVREFCGTGDWGRGSSTNETCGRLWISTPYAFGPETRSLARSFG